MQFEISSSAYETLTSTPDAKGNKIEVIKVPCPPPLFRTYKEAEGVAVSFPLHSSVALCTGLLPSTILCCMWQQWRLVGPA